MARNTKGNYQLKILFVCFKMVRNPMGMSLLKLVWPRMARNSMGMPLLKLVWPKLAWNPNGCPC